MLMQRSQPIRTHLEYFCWSIRHTCVISCSPFVYSPNDLPTARLQYLFNERLLQNAAGILHDKVPHRLKSSMLCSGQCMCPLCTTKL